MGVQIIQLYMSVWYTDLHNNIIHCSHFGAFYWFIKDVFEVLFFGFIIFWGNFADLYTFRHPLESQGVHVLIIMYMDFVKLDT